jgi:diguanylate cyclase (GGDEF)-like protein/PAS domain S-box-containing protein
MLPAIGVLATLAAFGDVFPAASGAVALFNLGLLIVAVAIARRQSKQRRDRERALRAEGERFRQLVETTSDWLWEVDENAVYTYASPRVRDLLGYEPHEVLGKTPFDLMPAEEAARVGALFGPIAARREPFAGLENTNRHKLGHLVVLETSGVPVFDANGTFRGYRGVDRDITERKRIAERLAQLAHHDSLTGLPNRALFLDRLQAAIEHVQHRGRHIAVLLFDLDRFKLINDTLGHAAGDRLLQSVAQRLTGALREDDTVARLGGDEFVILLVDVARRDDVAQVAQKLLDTLAAPHSIDGRELFVTTSIGVSVFPGDGADSASLMKHADIAMYRAKAKGRNNFQLYLPDMSEATPRRLAIETELRYALEREELELHYQPRVDLHTGKLVSFEALLRWQRPGFGRVSPSEFVPILEETGLIVQVGEWVLRSACGQVRRWHAQLGMEPHISVNLSPRQLRQHDFARAVERVLSDTGLAPAYLELELTESMLLEHTSHTIALLEELQGMGLRFAVDDFGTGYSSLAYLKRFPISSLKIDRSFVEDIETGQDSGAIARTVIAMAHSLGMRAVAEGVETRAQLEFLKRHGCDEGQGYWFSKPQPPDTITACLREGRCIGSGLDERTG